MLIYFIYILAACIILDLLYITTESFHIEVYPTILINKINKMYNNNLSIC